MTRTPVCQCEDCPRFQCLDKPLRLVSELTSAWEFECQTCLNRRFISKTIRGFEGTLGAGRTDDPTKGRGNQVGYTG